MDSMELILARQIFITLSLAMLECHGRHLTCSPHVMEGKDEIQATLLDEMFGAPPHH
jgi:hypothetical protein